MKTVATFSFPYEAHIARARLQAEGVPAFVADENTINMQWLYSDALGGVRVQVPAEHLTKAREILAHDYSADLEAEQGADNTRCPACGGTDLSPITQGKRMAFLMFLLVNFPLWSTEPRLQCDKCSHKFTPAADTPAQDPA